MAKSTWDTSYHHDIGYRREKTRTLVAYQETWKHIDCQKEDYEMEWLYGVVINLLSWRFPRKFKTPSIEPTESHKIASGLVVYLKDSSKASGIQLKVDKDRVRFSAAVIEKQDNNIRSIAEKADQLVSVEDISPLEPDWFLRFHDCAKNASSEEVQEVWAKILAGELGSVFFQSF